MSYGQSMKSKSQDIEVLKLRLREFAVARDWEQFHSVRNLILALVGEVGELAAEFQWISDDDIVNALQDSGKRGVGAKFPNLCQGAFGPTFYDCLERKTLFFGTLFFRRQNVCHPIGQSLKVHPTNP